MRKRYLWEVEMAQRDRSQGFGFVYVDIQQLLAQRDAIKRQDFGVSPPTDSQAVNLNRDPQPL